MIVVDALLRFSAVGLMVFVSILCLRDMRRSPSLFYLLLANVCVTSHFLGFTPPVFELPLYLRMVLRFLDVFQLYFLWLFALSLFQKDFRINAFYVLAGVVYSTPMLMERLVQFRYIDQLPTWWALLVNGLNLLVVIHMMVVTIKGRADDLIESRRRSRIYVVLMLAFSATSVVVLGYILLLNGWTQYQPTVNVFSIWPAIVWIGFWLTEVNEGQFTFDVQAHNPIDQLSARDQQLADQLQIEVRDKRCFLEPGLSIDSLAKKLGVSAYRLRQFINQTLGYSNFSSYINTFRIEAIKQALSDTSNEHIPILTLALNHGFNSLAPFNRAFKQAEGVTPSAYRKNLASTC